MRFEPGKVGIWFQKRPLCPLCHYPINLNLNIEHFKVYRGEYVLRSSHSSVAAFGLFPVRQVGGSVSYYYLICLFPS